MKKLTVLLSFIYCLLIDHNSFGQAQEHFLYVEASNLPEGVFTPSLVGHLQGPHRQKKQTWGLIETVTENGDSTLSKGYITQVKRGDTLSLYRVGDTTFALPTKHYFMQDGILRTRKGKKIECLLVELDPCPCNEENSIAVGPDSVTTNTMSPYKLILSTKNLFWRSEGGTYLIPGIETEEVRAVDKSKKAAYGLGIVTGDGVACDILWLHIEERDGPVKHQLFEVSFREGKRFTKEGEVYKFDGEPINSVVVFRDEPRSSVGAKKQQHKKKQHKF